MSDTPKPAISPIDKLIADISTAMHEWSEEQVTSIRKKVHARLDQHRDEVLMKLMGFTQESFTGHWEIDHCNGRSGNSPIGEFLATSQKQAIEEWLTQITMPTMTPKFKKEVESDLRKVYQDAIRREVWDCAKSRAKQDLDELLEHALSPTLLQQFLQMQKLIEPPTSNQKA